MSASTKRWLTYSNRTDQERAKFSGAKIREYIDAFLLLYAYHPESLTVADIATNLDIHFRKARRLLIFMEAGGVVSLEGGGYSRQRLAATLRKDYRPSNSEVSA